MQTAKLAVTIKLVFAVVELVLSYTSSYEHESVPIEPVQSSIIWFSAVLCWKQLFGGGPVFTIRY